MTSGSRRGSSNPSTCLLTQGEPKGQTDHWGIGEALFPSVSTLPSPSFPGHGLLTGQGESHFLVDITAVPAAYYETGAVSSRSYELRKIQTLTFKLQLENPNEPVSRGTAQAGP